MKIRTSYPGQPVSVVEAPEHIERQLLRGVEVPYVTVVPESDHDKQLQLDMDADGFDSMRWRSLLRRPAS